MPVRNVVTIVLALIASQLCYFTATRNRYAKLVAESFNVVEEHSLVQVPQRELFKSAMEGMLRKLDPNSQFLADDFYRRMEEDISQEFAGVGLRIQIASDTQRLTIVRPMPKTPAQRAGLQSGDIIWKIDGKSTVDMNTSDASQLMRGPAGESVKLTIHRKLIDPFDVTIVREQIPVPSIFGDTQNDDGSWNFQFQSHPHIGYIRLEKFGDRSVEELQAALAKIDGKAGLVLDLRSNLGGLLDAAVEICDMFLPADNLIVSTRGRQQRIQDSYYSSSKQAVSPNMPMVILINRRSASASEIVAACLQDYGRAVVIGERSYGKGTVQNLIPIENNRSYIKLTVASYWRPSNKNIDRTLWDQAEAETKGEGDWGVTPNDGYSCEMSLDQVNRIDIARLMRDNDPLRKDLDEPQEHPEDPTADDAGPEPSSNSEATETTEPAEDPVGQTADQLPEIPQRIPRWESIDTPMKKAIEYLESLTKSKVAA